MDGLNISAIPGCACSKMLLNCGLRRQADPLTASFTVSIGGNGVALPAGLMLMQVA